MIRGVVFDLDHTLFDRYATITRVMPEFYRHYRDKIAAELSEEEFIRRLIPIEKKGIYHSWNKVFEMSAAEGIILPMTKEETHEAIQYIINVCWLIDAVPYPFTNPTLKKIKEQGYKLGIITNGPNAVQTAKIKKLGLEPFFDEIVITGNVGVHKPSREPFDIMSERLGIPAKELLYVGDHPLNDVEGSRNAGYIPVWVKTTGVWPCGDIERSPYEVDTVEEIPALLEKINK